MTPARIDPEVHARRWKTLAVLITELEASRSDRSGTPLDGRSISAPVH